MSNKQTFGSRAQVMHGNAVKTSGGLTKSQLKYNKQGKIVSKKASALAKKNNRLVKAGYITRKGEFGTVMKGGDKLDKETVIRDLIETYKDNVRQYLETNNNNSSTKGYVRQSVIQFYFTIYVKTTYCII